MPPDLLGPAALLALSMQTTSGQLTAEHVQLQYSQISPVATRLPAGIAPSTLLGGVTGGVYVGEGMLSRSSELQSLVTSSFEYIAAIASVLPIDEQDERIVEGLLRKRQEKLTLKPLQRREKR